MTYGPLQFLSHKRVEVSLHLLDQPVGMPIREERPGVETRRIDWLVLTVEERLELERLLGKALR